jgi:hypothetical protein
MNSGISFVMYAEPCSSMEKADDAIRAEIARDHVALPIIGKCFE